MAKVEKKICDRCGKEKSLTDFPKKKNVKSGYLNICRECERARVNSYFVRYSERYFQRRYYDMQRRADEYEVNNDLTYEDFLDVIVADDPESKECVYCGKTESQEIDDLGKSLALDHVLPLHLTTHTKWNLANCCASCNSIKRHKHLLKFYKENDFFTEERLYKVIKQMADNVGYDFVTFYSFIEALETGLPEMEENHKRLKELQESSVKAVI